MERTQHNPSPQQGQAGFVRVSILHDASNEARQGNLVLQRAQKWSELALAVEISRVVG